MKSEREKLLSNYIDVWIVYVLRTYSDSEHPLTINRIVSYISELTGLGNKSTFEGNKNPISKTVERRLEELEGFGYNYESGASPYAEAFYRVIGGQVKLVNSRPKAYYFVPILDSGDVSMICAAIESNHYLSPEESGYLISRECAACSYKADEMFSIYYKGTKNGLVLPKKPRKKKDPSLIPSRASVTLDKISLINYAIKKKLQISVIPGTYITKNDKIQFVPKSDRESVLNPYAFISQNGQYYIVATHSGFANPAHYRIDRIYSVKLINTGVGNKKSYAKREEIPLRLRRFFKGNKFNADAYTSAYPLMAYHEKRGIQKCAFVCLESALTVAIDYFGTADPVKISEYDKDDNYVRVEVFADYNNVKMFCTQYYSIVTPISPEELKDDVRTQVEGLLERLDKFV